MEEKKFGLSADTIRKINSVIQNFPGVEKVILYGSRAKGNFKPGSDIDLTLIAPTLTTTELLKMDDAIDQLLLPYKVDLSLWHQIDNADLIEQIQRIGVPFSEFEIAVDELS